MDEISTHTPLAGRDVNGKGLSVDRVKFLLTRPLRDVTQPIYDLSGAGAISTHTPLAGRDQKCHKEDPVLSISTHTPLAGRDDERRRDSPDDRTFLLTRPLRDVTMSGSGFYD